MEVDTNRLFHGVTVAHHHHRLFAVMQCAHQPLSAFAIAKAMFRWQCIDVLATLVALHRSHFWRTHSFHHLLAPKSAVQNQKNAPFSALSSIESESQRHQ